MVSEIPGSLSWIPASKPQDSGFHEQKFAGICNLDYLKPPTQMFLGVRHVFLERVTNL